VSETFDRAYYEQQRPKQGLAKLVDEVRDRFIERQILKRVSGGTLLDVGCGVGTFLARMERRFAVTGSEISAAGLEEASVRVPNGVFAAGDIEVGLPVEGPFDVITAINVIEHLAQPGRAIRHLAAGQRSGGLLIVHLPTLGNRIQRWLYEGSYDQDVTHIYRPSGSELVGLVEAAGYDCVLSAYAPFVPVALLSRLPVHPAFLAVFERR
jgi:2-polyprenyl-3-methyl-5-hydroxy-6-metoxy-1,4-benzoquinol methylase